MSKRKLRALSVREKLELLSYYESGRSREELCTEFKVPRSTLCSIIKNKDKIRIRCAEGQGGLKRIRLSKYPELEKCLIIWVRQLSNNNTPVNGPMIKEKAQELARKLGIENFSSSNGWLDGFKRRNNLFVRKSSEEKNAMHNGFNTHDWTKSLSNMNENQQNFEVNSVDSKLFGSNDFAYDDFAGACSSSGLVDIKKEEEDDEEEEEMNYQSYSHRVTKREAERALETLQNYVEMSVIGDEQILDHIYEIKKYLMKRDNKRQTRITEYFN